MAFSSLPLRCATLPDFRLEREAYGRYGFPVAGADEVGRGALAGPVVAAAVILDPYNLPEGIQDSKKMTALQREDIFEHILRSAQAVAVSTIPAQEIDRINIRQASLKAMQKAIEGLSPKPACALIDGRDCPEALTIPSFAVVKGDSLSLSIAAASIVAKVVRDHMLHHLDQHFPAYGFSKHVGYPTAQHKQALQIFGVTPLHRMTFKH